MFSTKLLFFIQGLTAVDVTDDSSLIAGGFADSTVRVWSVTPKKLRSVKQAAGNWGDLLGCKLVISLYQSWFHGLYTGDCDLGGISLDFFPPHANSQKWKVHWNGNQETGELDWLNFSGPQISHLQNERIRLENFLMLKI